MSQPLHRLPRDLLRISLTTLLATTKEIDIRSVCGGAVLLYSDSAAGTLAYYGAAKPGGQYVQVKDATGAQITTTVMPAGLGSGTPLPDECFGYAALKIVVDVNTLADVALKS